MPGPHADLVRRALRLEYLTIAWNVVEGVIAVTAALASRSVALFGFGVGSFVECVSGMVMIGQLRAYRDYRMTSAMERRAQRLAATLLFVLGAYVAFDAGRTLWHGERPVFSSVGVALTGLSLITMVWLSRAKQRAAVDLGSRSLAADAFQTKACWWLSLATLIGVSLNGAFGWWWADPLAAFLIAALVFKEGREAWRSEPDCC